MSFLQMVVFMFVCGFGPVSDRDSYFMLQLIMFPSKVFQRQVITFVKTHNMEVLGIIVYQPS